jgi:hypothetical protein
MILQLNHLPRKLSAAGAQEVIGALESLLAEGHLEHTQFANLRVHLDWIQYRHNFREPVCVVPGTNERGEQLPFMELHVDVRQAVPGTLRAELLRAMSRGNPGPGPGAAEPAEVMPLEEFGSFRSSLAWRFNRLYWQRLADWEESTGKGYEQALPGGKSDANHPAAVADGVADFWTLLRDLESKGQLPPEVFALEIGVGMGTRAGLWLDRFRDLDRERGTNYYPRLRFLLGDYSPATLERSRPAVRGHAEQCSFIVLDALNPLQTLSFLRHKILHIHLTNVYDNLPDEELALRDGRLYLVEVRAYLSLAEARRICSEFDVPPAAIRRCVERLLDVGPEHFPDRSRGVAFWQQVWGALRLEERMVCVDDLPASALPEGLDSRRLEEVLRDAPSELRFHLSTGAFESFRNTLPLLSARGYLQVQDIFVTDLSEYRLGFHGPGKLDGSIVNWVNGVLLREAAERAGYDVHFAPFRYREGSKTSILYTTQRE